MESFNSVMNKTIMGNTKFSRFYDGLRVIEKAKALDAKLAKDSGGASKPKQKSKAKVAIKTTYVHNFQRNRFILLL